MSGLLKLNSETPFVALDVDRLETALWMYDFDAGRIVWANRAALKLWDAASVEALLARDLLSGMSGSVALRLAQHRDDFEKFPEREFHEFWTLYPDGAPFRVRAILRRCVFEDGRIGMSVEAHPEEQHEPETIRSADALLHTQVITALFDGKGCELYANPAFRAAFGPGRHKFGRDFVTLADRVAFEEGMAAAGEHRMTVAVRTVMGERWHDLHAVRCRDAVTGDGAFLISATDVTASREYEMKLSAARDDAEAAYRAKAQFLSTMSHEMRTPLNGVLGMAGLLAGTGLDAKQRKYLDMLSASGAHMLEIVEDVLEIVHLDAGSVKLSVAPFDPAMAVRSVTEMFRDQAEARGLSLSVEAEIPRNRTYAHDAARIRQVLRHFVANAVKFTDKGAVVVRVGLAPKSALRFDVIDTGSGIPEAEREAIFERFHQVDGTDTRRHGGIGLGLAICRDLVALFGGEIGVESREGVGSTFWFTVPGAAGKRQPGRAAHP
jgi:signal transduction histidine kinase